MENNPSNTPQLYNNSKLWLHTIIAVVLTTVIVGFGVYIWQQSLAQKSQTLLQQQITDLQKQITELKQTAIVNSTPISSPAILKNQEYTSSKFGFKVPLLPMWSVEEIVSPQEGFEGALFRSLETKTNLEEGIKKCTESGFCGEIKAWDVNFSVQPKNEYNSKKVTITPVIINGLTWKRLMECDGIFACVEYSIEHQNNVYVFTTNSNEAELKQLLAGFQWI